MIWIRIVSKDGAPASSLALGVPLAARFVDSVGDVGRGVGCTLVLPDPNREISRKQALVTFRNGRHFLRPIGGTNVEIHLNGRVVPPDVETQLDVGAEIRIGPYVMRVERVNADTTVPAPPIRPAPERQPVLPPVEAPPIRPLDSPRLHPALGPRPASAPPPRPATPQAPSAPQGAPAARPPAAQTPPRALPPQPPPPGAPARNAAQDPLAIFNTPDRPAKGGVFDDLLKSSINPPRPAGTPPQSPAARALGKLGDGAGRPPPQAPSAASTPPPTPDRADRAGAAQAKAGGPESARQDPGRQATPSDQGAWSNDAFVGALYGGLGIDAPPPGDRSPENGRLIGELLRESLSGTIELLAARQIAKKNLGASATMLQTRGNNPLKFSPNVDAALTHLLGPPMRGFIGPRDAVHDALGDLRAHQVAMLAGMRAALEAVLERFDPVALEARLAPKGMVEQLMPVNRRARLWESFGEQYASILREVEDDWDALFGKAFLQAYERQLEQLEGDADGTDVGG